MTNHNQTPTPYVGGDHAVNHQNIMAPETLTSDQFEDFEDVSYDVNAIEAAFPKYPDDDSDVNDIEAGAIPGTGTSHPSGLPQDVLFECRQTLQKDNGTSAFHLYPDDNVFDMSSRILKTSQPINQVAPDTETALPKCPHYNHENIMAPQPVATDVRFRDSAPMQSTDRISGSNRWTNTITLPGPMYSIASHADNGGNGRNPLNSRSGRNTRRRSIPWTEEEHRLFLRGLQQYGRGDWKNILRYVVRTKDPSQVASHAQKFFLRLRATEEQKKRWSIHDIVDDYSVYAQQRTATNTHTAQQVQGLHHTSVSRAPSQYHNQVLEPQALLSNQQLQQLLNQGAQSHVLGMMHNQGAPAQMQLNNEGAPYQLHLQRAQSLLDDQRAPINTLAAQQVQGLLHTSVSRDPSPFHHQVLDPQALLLTQLQQLINQGAQSHVLGMMHNQGAPRQMQLNNEGAPYQLHLQRAQSLLDIQGAPKSMPSFGRSRNSHS